MFFSPLIQTVPVVSWYLMFSGLVIKLDLCCTLLQLLSVSLEVQCPKPGTLQVKNILKKGKTKIEVVPWVSRAK